MPVNDPELVREQYSREDNLRARQSLYAQATGPDPREVAWEAIHGLTPRRVLEVGGGPGELAQRMADELGAVVAFVDISPRMVELARERGVHAQVGDVQDLPFPDGSFDLVVAAWMLYHVPDIDRGLAEIARVLEPGGRLVAVTNSLEHLRELRDLIAYPHEFLETFAGENGERRLMRHFTHVDRRDANGVVTVRDRDQLVAYRASLSIADRTRPVPDDVDLPFLVRRASTVFVATK